MQYPIRPQIPNPYQIVGQAAQELGGQVQQYGNERDQLQARFQMMMEKRATNEIAKQQAAKELEFKQSEEKRKQGEYEQKEKLAAERAKFLARPPATDGAPTHSEAELQNALASGLIDAQTYNALKPKPTERFAAGGGYYEMGPDGKPKQIVAPRDDRPPRGQVVQDASGNFVVVDPTTGTSTPVTGADGKPVQGKGPTTLTGKQLENARTKAQTLSTLRFQLKNARDAWSEYRGAFAGPFGIGKIPTEARAKYLAAISALYTTIRQFTRTPGEGSMSDYESRLSMAQLPADNEYEAATEQKFDQLDDLLANGETGYTNLLGPQAAQNPPNPNPNPPQGETKVYKGVTYLLPPGKDRKDPKNWIPQGHQ